MFRVWKLLLIASVLSLSGCYYFQSTRQPIEFVRFPSTSDQATSTKDLMIFLPGIGDYPEAFEQNEFVRTLRESDLPVDAIAVNSHIGYYTNRSLLIRLKEDVIDPAFAEGYEKIHFVGVSLGGYGTLLYMRSHPEDIASAILIAPYLGEPDHYNYLLDMAGWGEPTQGADNIWPWLQSLPKNQLERVYVGYGDGDHYVAGQRLLGDMLPSGNSISIAGDHSWVTWRSLWPLLLSRAEQLQDEKVMAER